MADEQTATSTSHQDESQAPTGELTDDDLDQVAGGWTGEGGGEGGGDDGSGGSGGG